MPNWKGSERFRPSGFGFVEDGGDVVESVVMEDREGFEEGFEGMEEDRRAASAI